MNDFDLIWQLAEQGYSLLYNDQDLFELFNSEGSTGHEFRSILEAHKWVFRAKQINGNN